MMLTLKNQAIITERVGFLVYSLLILLVFFLKRDWVLSAIVGALTAIINFRIQVKGLESLAEKGNAFVVTGNFYLRMAIIGAVLFLSFSKPNFNPFVVFTFMFSFQFFVIIVGAFSNK